MGRGKLAAWRRDQRDAKAKAKAAAVAAADRQDAAVQNFLDLWRLIAGGSAITTREILADAALKDAIHVAMGRPTMMKPTGVSRYLSRLPGVESLPIKTRDGVQSPQWRLASAVETC
jgi:hypothetical protein